MKILNRMKEPNQIKELNQMNKILKILLIAGTVLTVLGLILAAVGYGMGGLKSVQMGPNGFYVEHFMNEDLKYDVITEENDKISEVNDEVSEENKRHRKQNRTKLLSAWEAYFR